MRGQPGAKTGELQLRKIDEIKFAIYTSPAYADIEITESFFSVACLTTFLMS